MDPSNSTKKETRSKLGQIGLFCLIIYIIGVLYFVFFSERLGRTTGYSTFHYNLIPFVEIRRFIVYRNNIPFGGFLLNLAGNIIVTVPFGVLITYLRTKKTSFCWMIINTFFFSLLIETTQLLTKVGVFDVDDLIMNVIGGGIGWCIFKILRYWKNRLERKKE